MKKEDILHTFYRGPEEGVDRFENRRCQAGLLQSFHRVVTQRVEHVAPVVHKQLARAGGRAGGREVRPERCWRQAKWRRRYNRG